MRKAFVALCIVLPLALCVGAGVLLQYRFKFLETSVALPVEQTAAIGFDPFDLENTAKAFDSIIKKNVALRFTDVQAADRDAERLNNRLKVVGMQGMKFRWKVTFDKVQKHTIRLKPPTDSMVQFAICRQRSTGGIEIVYGRESILIPYDENDPSANELIAGMNKGDPVTFSARVNHIQFSPVNLEALLIMEDAWIGDVRLVRGLDRRTPEMKKQEEQRKLEQEQKQEK